MRRRRLAIACLGAALLIAAGFVFLRSGPGAPPASPEAFRGGSERAPAASDRRPAGADSRASDAAGDASRAREPESAGEPQTGAETLARSRTPERLFGSAKVGAAYDGRQMIGVRIERVGEGSFWERLGVRDDDVILAWNGELVDDPESSVAMMNALSRDPVLRLRVRSARGEERTLLWRAP